MRLDVTITGDLERMLRAETEATARAVTAAVKEATAGLKQDLRAQVTGAGLGTRLANSWRAAVSPKTGTSLRATGRIWSTAPAIIRAHGEGAVIRGRDGFWLAIPLPAAPRKILGRRVTPGNLERAWGIRLRFVYRRGQASLLVATLRAGTRSGFRLPSARALRTGQGLVSVPMFALVPQVTLRPRFDIRRPIARWQEALPGLIAKHAGGT